MRRLPESLLLPLYICGVQVALSYEQPLCIVRGSGCYLYDEQGNAYLDSVNNVAHVGHSHPRVVEATCRQLQQLNTNSRYLHPNLTEYSQELLATMPPSLQVYSSLSRY